MPVQEERGRIRPFRKTRRRGGVVVGEMDDGFGCDGEGGV